MANETLPFPIGVSVQRVDGLAKVTGAARYASDVSVPGMAYAALVRSPYPSARIRGIDRSRAMIDGVQAIVAREDLPDLDLYFGQFMPDRPLIADGVVRYVGEPVVGVVASSPFIAAEAAERILVDYEPLPFVDDPVAALEPGAPAVHDTPPPMWRPSTDGPSERTHQNLCTIKVHGWGDVESAMRDAAFVLEGEFRFPRAFPGALEQYVALAEHTGQRLTVWSAAAHPLAVRSDLAKCFRLPLSQVRVVVPNVGGAFGGKSFSKIEPLVAALSLVARRPVKLALSVGDSMVTSRGGGALVRVRTGFAGDGRIVARDATMWLDSGAYADSSPGVTRAAATRLSGAYMIPALRVRAMCVYTNTSPAGSFRGFGSHEGTWASEQQMDEAAERLGLDPFEIRARNVALKGQRLWSTARPMDGDLRADLELLAGVVNAQGHGSGTPAPQADSNGRELRGWGIGLSASDAEVPNSISVSLVRLHVDGSLTVSCGSVEIGQGSGTILAQIAAAEMGIDMSNVHVIQSDTDVAPYERSTGASRTTTFAGRALQEACSDLKRQLVDMASELCEVPPDAIRVDRGGVVVAGQFLAWHEVVGGWFGGPAGELIGRGYIRRTDAFRESPPFWEIGCVGAGVAVDPDTGATRVVALATVADVGQAINPAMMESQDAGAATMGMGLGLFEEMVYRDGSLTNGSLYDYRLPRFSDLPTITSVIASRGDGIGPYGAKGAGEGGLNPTPPAIANAIYRATGVRVREAPITPERLWRALHARDASRGATDNTGGELDS